MSPATVTDRFRAQIILFDVDMPITKGHPCVLHMGALNEPAFISSLVALLDKATGDVIKKNPRCLVRQATAVVEMTSARPLVLDTFRACRELGRFLLRSEGKTIAAGVVTELLARSVVQQQMDSMSLADK